MKRALLLIGACALVVPALAWAHASLKQESPGFGQEVAVAPRAIEMAFDQFVQFPSVEEDAGGVYKSWIGVFTGNLEGIF